jgi:glutamyl-tRNA reductase
MQILQLGLNHESAPIEIREQLAFSERDLPSALQDLCPDHACRPGDAIEGAILSTCNRVEVYATVSDPEQGQQSLQSYLSRISGVPGTILSPCLQARCGEAAATHLCEVTCGLDSMVLGESQIQGQVAEAYELALRQGVAGATINALFRTALRAGKRARTETEIARHAASISHAAVELASRIFDELAQKNVLLIGAGEMAELAAKNLVDNGVGSLAVVNRSTDRARRLASQFGGQAMGWDSLSRGLCQADIVISSTAAPHLVLTQDIVATAMRRRRNRYLFIIDIAVPRDVEPAIGKMPNVYLYDIDDLKQVVDANLEQRKREIPHVQAIVREEVAAFMDWFQALDVVPTIVDLRERAEDIRNAELQRALAKLGDLSDQEQDVILSLSQRIVNKILHQPTVRLKQHAGDLDSYRYVEALRDLFDLKVRKKAAREQEYVDD